MGAAIVGAVLAGLSPCIWARRSFSFSRKSFLCRAILVLVGPNKCGVTLSAREMALNANPHTRQNKILPQRACLKNRPAMGLRTRRAGWLGATREHIRRKSVTEEQRRQPAGPAARPPGIFFRHALSFINSIIRLLQPKFKHRLTPLVAPNYLFLASLLMIRLMRQVKLQQFLVFLFQCPFPLAVRIRNRFSGH